MQELAADLEPVAASDEGLEALPDFSLPDGTAITPDELLASQPGQRANGSGSYASDGDGFNVRPSERCGTPSPLGVGCTFREFHSSLHSWNFRNERADDMPMGEAMLPGMPEPAEPIIPEPEPTDYDIPFEAQFNKKDFKSAPGIKAIAERHIATTDAFSHLRDVEIRYFWKRRGGLRGGNPRYGALTRPTGLAAYALGQPVYALWLAADHCRDGHWTEPQFEAQIFDLLAHSAVDPDDHSAYRIVGDDFAGMRLTLQRFGLWQADLKAMAADLRQLPIEPLEGEASDAYILHSLAEGDSAEDGDE